MTRYGSDAAPELSLKTFPEERFESTSQEESRSESEFHDNNRNSVNCNRSRFLVAQSIFRRKSKRDIKGNSDISRRCNKKISINRKIILFPFLGFYKYCKKGKTHRPDCNTEKIEISDISLKSIAINHARSTNSLTSSESVSSGSENFTSTALSFKSKLCSSVSLESRNTSHAFNLEEVEEVNEIEEEVNEIEEEVDSNTTISSNNASFTSHDNSTSNISSEEKIIKSGCSALDVLSSQTEISRRCAQSQSCLITSKEDALKSYTNSITEEAICAIVVTKSGPLFNAKISDTRCNTLLANPNICIDDKNEKESSRVSCDHIDFSSSDYPFDIFGTNANDTSVCPHVLFPSLLNKLRAFFPYVISEDNLWLKYSLVRDGSSISTLLSKICEPKWTLLAIETMEGEIFGSFTSAPWRCNNLNYFGRGESFLWRLCSSRRTPRPSTTKHLAAENQLEVFTYTGSNSNEQLCNNERIAVGRDSGDNMHDGGVGLLGGHGIEIDSLLLNGSSKPTTTFNNPSLTQADDGRFTVSNMEIWTTTPCYTENEAIKLEKRKLLITRQLSNP